MKNIESLVEEALKEMKRPVHIQYHQENLKKILTTLEQFMQSLTPEQIELAKRLKIEEGEG